MGLLLPFKDGFIGSLQIMTISIVAVVSYEDTDQKELGVVLKIPAIPLWSHEQNLITWQQFPVMTGWSFPQLCDCHLCPASFPQAKSIGSWQEKCKWLEVVLDCVLWNLKKKSTSLRVKYELGSQLG